MDASRVSPAAAHADDIPVREWQGGVPDCGGCEPGRSCVHDADARRIDRFLRRHPQLASQHLRHPCFEVRRIVPERLPAPPLARLADDADLIVRHTVACRAEGALRQRLRNDPEDLVRQAAGAAHG